MASNVQSFLGNYSDLFAVAGVVSVSYIALKLALSIFNGIKVFLLAKPLGLTKNLKKCGQWAVVTGATDGIGKGYTHQLAKKGMDIILISRTKSKLEDCAKEIEQKFKVKTKIIVADFSAGLQIYDAIRSQLAGLDIGVLVNNVGMSYDFPMYFLEIPDREKKIMDLLHVNITSVTMMTSVVLPEMVSRSRGVVINVASASGVNPCPLLTVYSASKAFVHYFSLCLEREYRDRGITVQSVLPYFVATKMSKVKKGSFWIPYPDQYAASALDTVGFEKATNGWWSHSITGWLLDVIPKQTQMSILVRILLEKKKGAPIKRLNGSKTD
uniref:17 beta-hydroxysteroid dehydrogenase 12 n=1 Tax=Mytilus galloprovincialis TaxID=29158 RepID=U3GLV7_MYTGA|nr:17 beta-hydroxysteroid dehydrogenase 12 [Mytilus galloprovincialis]